MLRKLAIATALAAAAALPAAADWGVSTGTDAASYQAVSVLTQPAIGTIPDEYRSKEVRPVLEFRCVPGGGGPIRTRIDWGRFISSFNTEVIFTVDDRDPVTLKLGVDRSNKITSTKVEADDDALLDYLDGGETLAVTVTPYSEVPVSVEFALEGFGDGLDGLRTACGNRG